MHPAPVSSQGAEQRSNPVADSTTPPHQRSRGAAWWDGPGPALPRRAIRSVVSTFTSSGWCSLDALPSRHSCSRGDRYAGVTTLSSRRHRDGLKTDSTVSMDGVNGRSIAAAMRSGAKRCGHTLPKLFAHDAGYAAGARTTRGSWKISALSVLVEENSETIAPSSPA